MKLSQIIIGLILLSLVVGCVQAVTNGSLAATMTSNTAPSGWIASASNTRSNDYVTYGAWRAFNYTAYPNKANFGWMTTSGVTTGWLQIQLPSSGIATKYSLYCNAETLRAPKTFNFNGSNDGTNWIILDSRSGLTWSAGETKSYRNTTWVNTTNPSPFKYYRLDVSAINASGTLVRVDTLDITGPVPVASFSANATVGVDHLPVLLTDTSQNLPYAWAYSAKNVAGNNTWIPIGTTRNLSVTFGVGNWSLRLNATNLAGTGTSTQTTFVNVSTPFVASFTQNPSIGMQPLAVTFTDTSVNSSETINSWNWDFGDIGVGNTSTLQNPSHTYTTAGTYHPNLTIINTSYNRVSTKLSTVVVNATLAADFSGTPTSGGVPLSVAFSDTSTGVIS